MHNRGILTIDTNPISSNLLHQRQIVKSARVGLNMKKQVENQTEFIMKPYRYVAYPHLTKKGKIHIALSLHASGNTPEQIHESTGSPLTSINTWIAWYTMGTQQLLSDFVDFDLDNESLCRALGAWSTQYGSRSEPVNVHQCK